MCDMVILIFALVMIFKVWKGGVLFWNVVFCLSVMAGVGIFVYEKNTVFWELIAYLGVCGHICRNAIDRVSNSDG